MNQVLVIGGGPSHLLHFEECKKFKGTIVSTDRAAKAIMKGGVIPNYIVTAEAAAHLSQLDYFNIEETKKHPIEIIISERTRHELIASFLKNHIKFTTYTPTGFEPCRLPNVGLMAIHYAKNVLKADSIVIIGFEHEGDEYPEFTFRTWITCFWGWVCEWPDELIVNCSEGGVLYGMWKRRHVKKSTLKEVNSLLINK